MFVEHGEVEFEPVIGPRPKLELARLLVERKVRDVDGAGASVDGRGDPEDRPVRGHDGQGLPLLPQALVRTGRTAKKLFG